MSEENKDSPHRRNLSVIEVNSDDEGGHRDSVIEIPSDAESTHSDDGVEIVSVTPAPVNDDIQITGHNRMVPPEIQYPGVPLEPVPVLANPPPLRRSVPPPRAARNPRLARRPYPPHLRNVRRRPDSFFGLAGLERFALPAEYFEMFNLDPETQQALFQRFQSFTDSDEISSSIMARIEREDESAVDNKMENEKIYNRKALQKKQEVAKENPPGYTSDISPDKHLLCELCGVELGQGLPEDFKPDPSYDENLAYHAARCKVKAPWFCMRQCFDSDRELSKRVFAAKCGHVFCGRCIKNIANRPPGKRTKKQNEQVSVQNPLISAPRRCPAQDCGIVFNNKSKCTFMELFL